MKDKVIIITGPTASGKSDLAIKIAKKFNGEIISADSQQIYKKMNIGTNKINKHDMDSINHYFLDIREPNEEYSVNEFKESARKLIRKINKENKIPIVVGGTGFYIDSILFNMNYGIAKKDESIRKYYNKLAEEKGNNYIYEKLKEIDPNESIKYHPNEKNRIIRALETYKLSGKKPSQIRKGSRKLNEDIDPLLIFLNYKDRNVLYKKINARVLKMFDEGLEDEFMRILKYYNLNRNSKSLQAIGYKEFFPYLSKEIDKNRLIDEIQKNTRHYAKRQITWMKKYLNYDFSDLIYKENLNIGKIYEYIKEKYDL
ncbi:tRNA (adenosine(37)-N6)-dimethylallyltransferase MiaA [Anaerococcus sp. AGMB00486]|uniref:tRNA dimethylallyltransferase n=2 Tax=Anaerococcus TaxID=165779 RepID=A0ABX2N7D3_9FIRM|nr:MULTISPECIES: tRNA (adenosine(37)-N6)-dimethylallyltransferase MiaA [Anaerococcus]MDY3005489.1 tRNA (adenosine(37)-N6)-dimethylallyltransferase MiaA [Anaerococcus porci]MSS76915.1 tRNA (adenosine(37)-N6)-dimethylallyltransferase MiaA [Anaerococcus porci]NVF10599.1 tRNA (adenosine(37)-N6)-dimethylallyltransferase MiaA [Anaerococcus faecalis]